MNGTLRKFKRTAVHNLQITAAEAFPTGDVKEGITLPRELMRIADIAPYECVLITRQEGDNWRNRMHTFAVPGDGEEVAVCGSVAHLLRPGDTSCIIAATFLTAEQYSLFCSGHLTAPVIDIRFLPRKPMKCNDLASARIVLEYGLRETRPHGREAVVQRDELARVMLSNLVCGLTVTTVERDCLELNAELPVRLMRAAGLVRNQSIVVYNASRGGMSAESFVVPNLRDNNIVISGALSRVADVGDVIAEAAFAITDTVEQPRILYAPIVDAANVR